MLLPCWFGRRSGGWARNGRGVKALAYGAAGETRKLKFAKRTWNVSWNQQINFLVRSTDPVAEAGFGCASAPNRWGTRPECVLESTVSQSARLSRIGCVGEYLYGAPGLVPAALPWVGPEREGRKRPSPTARRVRHGKRKFAKRTWNVPWNQQINFLVRSTDPVAEARTHHKKARCMHHPRLVLAARAHPTVGNEAGMCPGINRFTKCAPIADSVCRGVP